MGQINSRIVTSMFLIMEHPAMPVAGPDLIPYLTTTDETHDTSWQAAVDPSVAWTPIFTTQASSIGSLIDPGVWFHLFFAADFTNGTAVCGACNTFFIFVNWGRRTLG